ncbi:hypothetical protein ACIQV3_36045 [Streptomyces sp. NPDC099050]|uniref:hypothetical protein n=1 Tax=Streptomyces sp. NPDC099050 TaxID=3366100 RepID=UPI003802DDE6
MAKDYVKHGETKWAAEKLLLERYGSSEDGRYGGRLPPEKAISAVLVALSGYATQGQEPGEVPAEDVLAALSQVDEARQRLDNMELRLISAARTRGTSWQKIADALGLGTRQSAETRALRLERGAQPHQGRDVASQRLEKARGRAAEAWCAEHEYRVREVSERLFDTSGAWNLEAAGGTARLDVHAIGELLAADGSPVALVQRLESVRHALVPYRGDAPKPTGKRAAAAAQARTDLVALLDDKWRALLRVTTARGEATG